MIRRSTTIRILTSTEILLLESLEEVGIIIAGSWIFVAITNFRDTLPISGIDKTLGYLAYTLLTLGRFTLMLALITFMVKSLMAKLSKMKTTFKDAD